MIKHIALFILIAGVSCKTRVDNTLSQVKFHNKKITELIYKYIETIKKDGRRFMTVICTKSNDTTSFIMIDSYPDNSKINLNGVTEINQVKIFFAGDCLESEFLTLTTDNSEELDKEAEKINVQVNESVVKMREPTIWEFYFKGDSLFKYIP